MKNPNDRMIKDFKKVIFNNGLIIPLIVIYEKPKDYPDKYVARLWDGNRPTFYMNIEDSLENIRSFIPSTMTKLNRQSVDDPCIVEVWI